MSQQTHGDSSTPTVRQLRSPGSAALADLAAIFDELQFVVGCCERLLLELSRGEQRDGLVVESVWVAALSSYARCFRPGENKLGLTVTDLAETDLQGDVVQWHDLLGTLHDFVIDGDANPRELFSVGIAQGANGRPEGIVITSVVRGQVDEATVRQTGRLAFELSKLVDARIATHQKSVFTAVEDMTAAALNTLPPIEVDLSVAQVPDDPAPGEADSSD